MKKFNLILLSILLTFSVFGNPISKSNAVSNANTFIKSHNLSIDQVSLDNLVLTETSKDGKPLFYVFSKDNGFIIVSGINSTLPIIGYSEESSFELDNMPPNLKEILSTYKEEVKYAYDNNIRLTETSRRAIENQLNNVPKYNTEVEHLLGDIKWNQWPYYNALCPYDETEGYRCPVGCVATAMAQIMKYWSYPPRGEGSYSYHSYYGTLSADFDTEYDWESMPAPRLTAPNEHCAKISYHCAISVEMSFSPYGSGAYQQNVPYCLATYFKYDNTAENVDRSEYSNEDWDNLLREELDVGRPIQYAGYAPDWSGGHSFVCDGYDDNGYFHYNWGWGGSYNGYFLTHVLIPDGSGVGGGSGDFSYHQHVVVGIKPIDITSAVPSGLNAIDVTSSSALLKWDRIPVASIYNVEIRKEGIQDWTILTSEVNNLQVLDLEDNTTYEWRIKAFKEDEDLESEYSEINTFVTYPEGTCYPVQDFTLEDDGYQNVTINWIAPPSDPTKDNFTYKIYRDDELIETTTGLTYTDENVEAGDHTYCIVVDHDDCSSDPICEDIFVEEFICYPVQNISYEIINGNNVKVSWDAPENNEIGVSYRFYIDGVFKGTIAMKSYTHVDVSEGTHEYCVEAVHLDCTSEKVCLEVDITTGIEDNKTLNIYPNPSNNIVNIDGVNVKEVLIYNNIGKLVEKVTTNTIDVSNYVNGVYMLNVIALDGTIYKSKLVVN